MWALESAPSTPVWDNFMTRKHHLDILVYNTLSQERQECLTTIGWFHAGCCFSPSLRPLNLAGTLQISCKEEGEPVRRVSGKVVSSQGQEGAASLWEPPRGCCNLGPFPAVQDRVDAQHHAELPRSAGGREGRRAGRSVHPEPRLILPDTPAGQAALPPLPPRASTHPGRATPARRRSCPG